MQCALAVIVGLLVMNTAPANAEERYIEEITVTARKREESMQDVPVAIQAFSTEQIELYGARDLSEIGDLATQVSIYPGGSGNGANLVIRGYGSTSLDPGIESSVGVNIDGVQTDRGHVVRQAFFDLDSVQILKGPQTLFFGKNSPAGVIAATSALPEDEFGIKIQVGYEFEADEKIIEGMITGPLSDTLSARLAFKFMDNDGWLENTAAFIENSNGEVNAAEPFDFPGAASDLGAEENRAARLTLDWSPTDSFNAVWRILITDLDSVGFQTQESNSCSGAFPITNGIVDQSGDCRLNGKTSHGALPPEIAAKYSIDIGNGEPFALYESVLSSLQLSWTPGEWELTSVTGFYDYDYERWDNFDGTTFIQLMGIQVEDQTTWSQEFRAYSTFDRPFNFMIGAYYETFERNSDNAGKIAALGPDPVTGYLNTWEGISTIDSDSYSFFGQVIWDVSDTLELTAGLRFTKDDKEASQQNVYTHFVFGPLLGILQPVGSVLISDFDDTNVSPEVTIAYRPTSNMTVYAAYRTGYKSGGFSTNTVLSSSSTGESLTFDPEDAEGGEIGIKSTLLDGRLRLNVTAYFYQFDDLQISIFDAPTVSFSVANAADAETKGIELDAELWVASGFSLNAQLGFNQGEYNDFKNAPCIGGQTEAAGCVDGVQDLSGEDLTRAPELTGAVGFSFERALSNDWSIQLASKAIYTDDYQTNTNNNPLSIQDSFWRINARVSVFSSDGKWNFSLIGRNLNNEWYQGAQADKPGGATSADLFGNVVRARQISLRTTYQF